MRRNYFSILLALLVSASMFSACGERQKEQEAERRIYVQLWSIRDAINADFTGTITQLAEMGYAGVELFGFNNGRWFGMSPTELRQAIEDVGMTIVSSHVARGLPQNPTDADWEAIWAWWDMAIEAHKEAGIKYMVTPSMPSNIETLDELRRHIDYFNQIGARVSAAGLRFGYHNHAFEFREIEGEIWLDYMLNNTNPDHVFFQLDVYWVVRGGKDVVDYFNRFPGRFISLHIKDKTRLGAPGIVDLEHIFNNLENSGAMYMIVEVEEFVGTPMEDVEYSFNYLYNASWFRSSYI
jgi:sugar phosphate isomerase/epimerase